MCSSKKLVYAAATVYSVWISLLTRFLLPNPQNLFLFAQKSQTVPVLLHIKCKNLGNVQVTSSTWIISYRSCWIWRTRTNPLLITAMSNGDGATLRNVGTTGMDHHPVSMSQKNATLTSAQEMEVDSGERRLNELGYKQELRREMVNPHSIGNLGCNICMCT